MAAKETDAPDKIDQITAINAINNIIFHLYVLNCVEDDKENKWITNYKSKSVRFIEDATDKITKENTQGISLYEVHLQNSICCSVHRRVMFRVTTDNIEDIYFDKNEEELKIMRAIKLKYSFFSNMFLYKLDKLCDELRTTCSYCSIYSKDRFLKEHKKYKFFEESEFIFFHNAAVEFDNIMVEYIHFDNVVGYTNCDKDRNIKKSFSRKINGEKTCRYIKWNGGIKDGTRSRPGSSLTKITLFKKNNIIPKTHVIFNFDKFLRDQFLKDKSPLIFDTHIHSKLYINKDTMTIHLPDETIIINLKRNKLTYITCSSLLESFFLKNIVTMQEQNVFFKVWKRKYFSYELVGFMHDIINCIILKEGAGEKYIDNITECVFEIGTNNIINNMISYGDEYILIFIKYNDSIVGKILFY